MGCSGFRQDINGLRGLSVALVVAFHLQLRGSGGGFIGVDVFFVISGYLMTGIVWNGLGRGAFSYWRFVRARAARIWPALAALVAVLCVLGVFLLPPADLNILARQAVRALLFSSNHFFLDRSGYDTRSADTHWLLHTWSLSVEWQFYLLYPLILMGVAAFTRRKAVALGWVAMLLTLSLACQVVLSRSQPAAAFFLLPARAWELLAGGLVFFAQPQSAASHAFLRSCISHAGLALVIVSALAFGYLHLDPVGLGWALLLPVAGVAMVLWADAPNNRLLTHGLLQKAGLWSYSIYLWHWPFIVALRMTDVFLDAPRLGALAVVIGSVVCGGLSFHWVESAVARPRWPRWAGFKPLWLMGLAGTLAGLVAATDGLAFRRGAGPGVEHALAAAIKADYFPDHCSNFMKTAAASRICSIPRNSRRRVLVIGDSHAEHLYPWFVQNSQVAVDFFTQAECPPVPRLERMQNGFHCLDYAGAAWQKAASADYDTVVLAARWAGVGLDGAPYCHAPQAGGPCRSLSVPDKQAAIRTELKSAIQALLARGKTVVMMAPTPEARVRVPERIARENFWYGQPRLVIDERSVAELAGWLTPLFDGLKQEPGFHLVSLNDKLCTGSVCKVFDPGLKRPVYIDESHFDPAWIAANGGVLTPFVQP